MKGACGRNIPPANPDHLLNGGNNMTTTHNVLHEAIHGIILTTRSTRERSITQLANMSIRRNDRSHSIRGVFAKLDKNHTMSFRVSRPDVGVLVVGTPRPPEKYNLPIMVPPLFRKTPRGCTKTLVIGYILSMYSVYTMDVPGYIPGFEPCE